jgi:hypothetical protein
LKERRRAQKKKERMTNPIEKGAEATAPVPPPPASFSHSFCDDDLPCVFFAEADGHPPRPTGGISFVFSTNFC